MWLGAGWSLSGERRPEEATLLQVLRHGKGTLFIWPLFGAQPTRLCRGPFPSPEAILSGVSGATGVRKLFCTFTYLVGKGTYGPGDFGEPPRSALQGNVLRRRMRSGSVPARTLRRTPTAQPRLLNLRCGRHGQAARGLRSKWRRSPGSDSASSTGFPGSMEERPRSLQAAPLAGWLHLLHATERPLLLETSRRCRQSCCSPDHTRGGSVSVFRCLCSSVCFHPFFQRKIASKWVIIKRAD